MHTNLPKCFAFVLLFCAAGCQSDQIEYKYPQKIKGKYEMLSAEEAVKKNDTVFDKKYLTFNLDKPRRTDQAETPAAKAKEPFAETEAHSGNMIEQKPLWVNVLPILSQYPISEIHQDSFIMTEWFSDFQNSSKQLKINAVKAGDYVRITVLCRQKDQNGEWINQKNDVELADKIKNDIVNQSLNN
ncbi:MAG: DUF3576 domain-containing protein [Alphaproteobacteria bacterium]|nr:DUF3576 domain-containing protein [Alphaproteobacteria bacterium]